MKKRIHKYLMHKVFMYIFEVMANSKLYKVADKLDENNVVLK